MPYVNLEIGLHYWGSDRYASTFRITRSGAENDVRREVVGLPMSNFDRAQFLPLLDNLPAYGILLGKAILGSAEAREMFIQALATAQGLNVPLRVQLVLSPTMPNLHDLHWEVLCDPVDGTLLFTRDDVLFSRYLSSTDARPVKPRNREGLRALAVISNPRNLQSKFRLPPVDVDAEVERIHRGMSEIEVTKLTPGNHATLDNILEELRNSTEGYDILHLVCHGGFRKGEAKLWLEDEDGDAVVVSGTGLCARLAELNVRPRLVVLVSCQSAGTGDDARHEDAGALAAVGPRLAQAGIPAVVAMQGQVSMETMDKFLPVFFRNLQREGQIDLAMARARATIRDRPDSWMPVLFLRLHTGRLWIAGADDRAPFEGWDSLVSAIENGFCTPILGPGMTEHLVGSHREIARRWAAIYHYPLAGRHEDDLPQVAQFLAAANGSVFPWVEYKAYLRRELLSRFGDKIDNLDQKKLLHELLAEVGRWVRRQDEDEPHRVLAELGCPLYISTNPVRLLADALTEAGKQPVEMAFDWRSKNSVPDPRATVDPDPQRPLVYSLFGTLGNKPSSPLILSQDDYFEYLAGAVRNRQLIPPAVRMALTDSALLFVGFKVSDWDFRVLLQSIRDRGGSSLLGAYKHIAVQLDPDEGAMEDLDMVRRAIEKMGRFDEAQITVFWGSVKDFMGELRKRLPEHFRAAQPQLVGVHE